MSQLYLPGIRKAFLPVPPYVPTAAAVVAKADLLSQLTQAGVVPHWALPLGLAPASNVPRSWPSPAPDSSAPCKTVNGRPVCAATSPLYCHPQNAWCKKPLDPEKPGSSHTKEETKRWVWSKSEGPRSN